MKNSMEKKIYPVIILTMAALILIFQNCGLEAPKALSNGNTPFSSTTTEDPGDGSTFVAFDHSIFPDISTCNSCHEKDRPKPEHFGSLDCVGCHTVDAPWNQPIQKAFNDNVFSKAQINMIAECMESSEDKTIDCSHINPF